MLFKIITIGWMIYILLHITVHKGIDKQYFSRENNNNYRGLFAVGIMLHHISQQTACDGIFIIWRYVGFIFVSYFFFSSGYGLMLGVLEKKDYLKHFWKKRILTLFVPYWIVNTLFVLREFSLGSRHSFWEYAASYLGFSRMEHLWYVSVILISYVVFYFCFRLFKTRTAIGGMSIVCMVYIVLGCIFHLNETWIASVSAFVIGILWKYEEEHIVVYLETGFLRKYVLVILLFISLFAGRLLLALKGIDGILLQTFMRNAISISFVALILMTSMKVKWKDYRTFGFLGSISYELYMIHPLFIAVRRSYLKSESLYIIFVVASSICSAFIIKKVSKLASTPSVRQQ
ncbi:acyltransferase family protein [uncultured Robinsoniella sp.]|uniref:acyltransferase family protein n=1 Tax=uncultured Robinsoniella sp. TaxID=904190 RepID=UPI00374F9845